MDGGDAARTCPDVWARCIGGQRATRANDAAKVAVRLSYSIDRPVCMVFSIYFQGFLITTALLALEHLALYTRLKPRGDSDDYWRVLIKFGLGVLAILAGCAAIAWQGDAPEAILAPIAASAGGLVIVAGYAGRWLWGRAVGSAYIRGRLAGLADKADIAEDGDGR